MCALLSYSFQYIDSEKQVQTSKLMVIYDHDGKQIEFDAFAKTLDATIQDAKAKYTTYTVESLRTATKIFIEKRNQLTAKRKQYASLVKQRGISLRETAGFPWHGHHDMVVDAMYLDFLKEWPQHRSTIEMKAKSAIHCSKSIDLTRSPGAMNYHIKQLYRYLMLEEWVHETHINRLRRNIEYVTKHFNDNSRELSPKYREASKMSLFEIMRADLGSKINF